MSAAVSRITIGFRLGGRPTDRAPLRKARLLTVVELKLAQCYDFRVRNDFALEQLSFILNSLFELEARWQSQGNYVAESIVP
jgi:hypothetical protein